MRTTRAVATSFTLIAWLTTPQVEADSALGDEMSISAFIDTYSAAALHLEERHRNMRVVGVIDTFDAHGETEFRSLDDAVLRVVQASSDDLDAFGPFAGKGFAQVNRFGPDYGFRLSKSNPDKRYRIIDLTRMDELDTSAKKKFVFERGVRVEQFLKAPVLLYTKTIREWLDADGFHVKSVRRTRATSSNDRVDVDVELTTLFPEDTHLEVCTLTFLPHVSWVLARYEAQYTVTTSEGKFKMADGARMTYASASAKANLFPDTVEIYQKDRETGEGSTYTFKTNRVELGTVKPEELTLTAFGLRDITQTHTAPNYWLIVGLALAVPLALCAIFWAVKRRRSKKKYVT